MTLMITIMTRTMVRLVTMELVSSLFLCHFATSTIRKPNYVLDNIQ